MKNLDKFIKSFIDKNFKKHLEEQNINEKDVKQFQSIEIKSNTINEKARTVEVVASSEVEDRDGDIIKINGGELDNFIKNPVILFGHNYAGLPVAKAVGVKIEDNQIILQIQFPEKEVYEFADTVFKMIKTGYLNAVSIGFIPKKQAYDEELKAYVVEKWEMLETSIVAVPANQDALIRGFKGYEKDDNIEDEDKEDIEKQQKQVLSLYRKYQVKLREIVGVEATEDELETIKEVFDSVVGVCNLAKKSMKQEQTTLEDDKNSKVSKNYEPMNVYKLANSLY